MDNPKEPIALQFHFYFSTPSVDPSEELNDQHKGEAGSRKETK